MKEFTVKVVTVKDATELVNIVGKYSYEVDLVSGRYVIDAKSLMGIFSLDLSRELTLRIHSEKADDLVAELAKYIVK